MRADKYGSTALRMSRRRCLSLVVPVLGAAWLSGCSSSERFGSLIVPTNLSPGTAVALETQTEELGYVRVATVAVDAEGVVRFSRLLPGEYRMVALDAAGQPVFATPAFGVSAHSATVPLVVASAPASAQ